MKKYEKFKLNNLNNTNTSINFIMDSLNKTDFEIMKEINSKSKKETTNNKISKKFEQSAFPQKKAHNKLESFILGTKKNYSKYNKVPHHSNKLTNMNIDLNAGIFHPERGSDINCYKYYDSNTFKSILSESGDSRTMKTVKNSHSFKKDAKNNENKFIINKFLTKNIYNINSTYKKNSKLNKKIKIQINEKKFNSFKKVPNNNKIKIKEKNSDEIIENYFLLNDNNKYNNNYYDNSHLLYVIDDEQKNIYQNINNPKNYSDKNDYDLIINSKENNIDIIFFELLKLNERKWLDEIDAISNILIEKRENMDDNTYIIFIHKMVKLYEHFNWLVNSIARYFNNVIFENNSYDYNNVDLPRFENIWFKGFKWKGLFIRVVPQDKSKFILNEIKALNYFFLDYLQIIDKYRNFLNNKNPLSNYIIFPLISYAEVNGFILYCSSLINLENNIEQEYSLISCLDEIIKENKGFLRLYSNINNLSCYISVNKNKNYNINNNRNSSKLFLNLMDQYYDVNDLFSSKLFSSLNMYHFLKLQKGKFFIFNLAEFLPKLFETKINSMIKINYFSVINKSRKYYSIKYDIQAKRIYEREKQNIIINTTPIDIISNIYNIDIKSPFKKKDIKICGIHFRILYEAQHINNKSYKNKSFVDFLFNYDNSNNSNKNNFINNKYETYVTDPYVILYDLLEPIKLRYSLIKNIISFKNGNNNLPNIY